MNVSGVVVGFRFVERLRRTSAATELGSLGGRRCAMKVKLSKDNFSSLTFTPGGSGAKDRKSDFWAFRRLYVIPVGFNELQVVATLGVAIISGLVLMAGELDKYGI